MNITPAQLLHELDYLTSHDCQTLSLYFGTTYDRHESNRTNLAKLLQAKPHMVNLIKGLRLAGRVDVANRLQGRTITYLPTAGAASSDSDGSNVDLAQRVDTLAKRTEALEEAQQKQAALLGDIFTQIPQPGPGNDAALAEQVAQLNDLFNSLDERFEAMRQWISTQGGAAAAAQSTPTPPPYPADDSQLNARINQLSETLEGTTLAVRARFNTQQEQIDQLSTQLEQHERKAYRRALNQDERYEKLLAQVSQLAEMIRVLQESSASDRDPKRRKSDVDQEGGAAAAASASSEPPAPCLEPYIPSPNENNWVKASQLVPLSMALTNETMELVVIQIKMRFGCNYPTEFIGKVAGCGTPIGTLRKGIYDLYKLKLNSPNFDPRDPVTHSLKCSWDAVKNL